VIRYRARDVADQDAGAFASARELAERLRIDRLGEGLAHRGVRVGKLGQRPLADERGHGMRWQPDIEPGLAISKMDAVGHRTMLPRAVGAVSRRHAESLSAG
jgi:hypothetical protein